MTFGTIPPKKKKKRYCMENTGNILTYNKLFKHKRKPRKETDSFSKNTEKTVYEYGDGAYKTQSILSGRYSTYNKKGREIKNR